MAFAYDPSSSVSFSEDTFAWGSNNYGSGDVDYSMDWVPQAGPVSFQIDNFESNEPSVPKPKATPLEIYLSGLDSISRERAEGIIRKIEEDPTKFQLDVYTSANAPFIPLPPNLQSEKPNPALSTLSLASFKSINEMPINGKATITLKNMTEKPGKKANVEVEKITRPIGEIVSDLAGNDNLAAQAFGAYVARKLAEKPAEDRESVAQRIIEVLGGILS